jgi:hypothetical protein
MGGACACGGGDCFGVSQKLATVVLSGIAAELYILKRISPKRAVNILAERSLSLSRIL